MIENQKQDFLAIQKSVLDAESFIKKIPKLTDIENLNNHTIDTIVKLQLETAKKSEECNTIHFRIYIIHY